MRYFTVIILLLNLSSIFAQRLDLGLQGLVHTELEGLVGGRASILWSHDNWIDGVSLSANGKLNLFSKRTPNEGVMRVQLLKNFSSMDYAWYSMEHQIGLGYEQLTEHGELISMDPQSSACTMFCGYDYTYEAITKHSPVISYTFQARPHFPRHFGIYAYQNVTLSLNGSSYGLGLGLSFGPQTWKKDQPTILDDVQSIWHYIRDSSS